MNNIQEHVEKVREALQKIKGAKNYHDVTAYIRAIEVCTIDWLQDSLDIIEQQQREIDTKNELLERILKNYKDHKAAKYHNPTTIELIGKLVERHLEVSKDEQ
jgi:pyruvate/2-oxoacid:ferredoxin oxidoreductase beta subunit